MPEANTMETAKTELVESFIKYITGVYLLQQEFIDLTHPGDTKSCDAKPSLRFTPYGKNLDSGYLKHVYNGVVHQIISPISNSESTIFVNKYLFDFFSTGNVRKNTCFQQIHQEFVFFFN